MASESPVALIYGFNGTTYVETSIRAGIAVPAGQPGFLALGSDGTNTRYIKVSSTGVVSVDGSAVTQPVSGTFFQATQPVSGPLTDTQLRATAVPVSGTFFQATQPVSIAATVAISAASLPLPTGAATEASLAKLTITQGTALGSNTQTLSGASVTTAAPTYTTGQISPLSLTTAGLLRVDASGTTLSAAQSGTWNINNVTGTVSLPTGAATSALQTTGNSSLSSIDTKTLAAGQAVMASSSPVVIASNQSAIPVTGTFFQATQPVSGTFFQATQPVSIAATVAVSGPLTDTQLRATAVPVSQSGTWTIAGADATATGALGALNAAVQVSTAGLSGVGIQLAAGTLIGTLVPEISWDGGTTWNSTYFSDVGTGILSGNLIFGSANTAAARVIIGGAGSGLTRVRVSAYTSGTANITVRASNIDDQIFLFEGAPALPAPPSLLQMGGVALTAAPTYTTGTMNPLSLTTGGLLRVDTSGTTVSSTQGTAAALAGAWPTKITDGTTAAAVKAASTAAVATDTALVVAISPNNVLSMVTTSSGYGGQVEGRAAAAATPVGNPVYIGGTDGTVTRAILTDTTGRIIVAPAGASSSASGFSFGDITVSAVGAVAVRRTTLTEQVTNAQRSIVSASANDASAGTGARQVKITYLTATFTGPFTETVTLNGTTAVNTVSTTICYVEKLEVVSVGSTGSNVGAITLKAATAGGGATIMTMNATDNLTFLALHYVPTGKTCYITGVSASSDATAIGQGGLYSLRAQDLSSATAPNRQVSDFVRLYGQSSGITRNYGTPIQVAGPARIQVWVNPASANTVVFAGAFDFYDQ